MRMVSKISRTRSHTRHKLTDAPHRGYLIVQAIPSSTKEAFKRQCVGRETMRDAIIRLMRLYVRLEGKLPE